MTVSDANPAVIDALKAVGATMRRRMEGKGHARADQGARRLRGNGHKLTSAETGDAPASTADHEDSSTVAGVLAAICMAGDGRLASGRDRAAPVRDPGALGRRLHHLPDGRGGLFRLRPCLCATVRMSASTCCPSGFRHRVAALASRSSSRIGAPLLLRRPGLQFGRSRLDRLPLPRPQRHADPDSDVDSDGDGADRLRPVRPGDCWRCRSGSCAATPSVFAVSEKEMAAGTGRDRRPPRRLGHEPDRLPDCWSSCSRVLLAAGFWVGLALLAGRRRRADDAGRPNVGGLVAEHGVLRRSTPGR